MCLPVSITLSCTSLKSSGEDTVFGRIRNKGCVPRMKEDYKNWINILDNFSSFFVFILLVSNVLCKPKSLESDPDPVWILTDPGWFSGSRTSMKHLTRKVCKQKRLLKALTYSFNRFLKNFLRLRYKSLDPNPNPNLKKQILATAKKKILFKFPFKFPWGKKSVRKRDKNFFHLP